jgi:hypothetical protein
MDIKSLSSSKPAALAIILAVSFGVYFNALFNGFVYDDRYLILQNPWIRDARHIPDIFLTNKSVDKRCKAYSRHLPDKYMGISRGRGFELLPPHSPSHLHGRLSHFWTQALGFPLIKDPLSCWKFSPRILYRFHDN